MFSTRDPSPSRTLLSQSSGVKEGEWSSLSHPVLSLHSGGNVAVISQDKLFLLRWVQTPSAAPWGRGERSVLRGYRIEDLGQKKGDTSDLAGL